ncbi:MAG: hypothetical protein AB7R55_12690 [Gemmatimonadales bacterium]
MSRHPTRMPVFLLASLASSSHPPTAMARARLNQLDLDRDGPLSATDPAWASGWLFTIPMAIEAIR